MAQKDFLSQFSSENKPDSFKEEERVKVVKEKKPLNPLFIVIPVLVLLIALGLVYLFLLRPNIEVENFVGQKQSDATAWIKQQEIETAGIIFKEEYNFDNDSGIIIEQDPFEGKVTKKAKMTFVVSKGADPNEKIGVPSLIDMSREEIDKWIKNNKLTQTKINTTYDDTVEKDKVIKVDFAGCDEDTFTRGCSLKISISKGAKPEDEIEMVNYIGKTYAEFETWATSKKLKLTKSEAYSDYYEIGIVTYQSAKEKEKVKAGDTINVTVSKGKAVKAQNFVNSKLEDVQAWAGKNGISLIVKKEYDNNYAENRIIRQSIAENQIVEDEITVTYSLGMPKISDPSVYTLESLREWKNEANEYGADLHTGDVTYRNSDSVPVWHVIEISSTACGSNLNPIISLGRNIYVMNKEIDWKDIENKDKTEEEVRKLCSDNGLTYEVVYVKGAIGEINKCIKIEKVDIKGIASELDYDKFAGTYISEAEKLIITIVDGEAVVE